MLFLTRLLAELQFAFGLEPIIKIATMLFATFQLDFVRAISNLLFYVCGSRCFR